MVNDFAKKHFYTGMDKDDAKHLIIENFDEIKNMVWELYLDEAPIDWNNC